MAWTQERISMLVKLWLSGRSASTIAEELGGLSRNAVIGKVHRLGISNRNNFIKMPQKDKMINKTTKKTRKQKDNIVIDLNKTKNKSKRMTKLRGTMCEVPHPNRFRIDSILNLNEKTCKWPVGHPKDDDFHFCGCPTNSSIPYCAYHATIAYTQTTNHNNKNKTHITVNLNMPKHQKIPNKYENFENEMPY